MMMEGGKHKVRRNSLEELVCLEPRSARCMRGRLWVVEKDGPEDHLSEDCKHEKRLGRWIDCLIVLIGRLSLMSDANVEWLG